MPLYNQPMFQSAMLKAHSKASMRGNRPQTRGIQSRLAEMDLARKAAFRDIGLSKKRSDLTHKGRMAGLKMDKKALADRKKQLPYTIGIGAGTAILSGLEGHRRSQMIKERQALEESRYQNTQRNARGNEALWRSRMLGIPGMGINE